ncbi:MAG: macro domain-containing protein [Ignavibacteriales bacterium]|nr:macro domain-containing protein [Ignavibacteriales bacterium]
MIQTWRRRGAAFYKKLTQHLSSMKIHVGHGEILILQGDIADQQTDAIVNAANNHLWMGAGVAGAIRRKGGSEIEREAMAKGPIEIGQAVLTSAGALNAKHVIHAAVMGQDLHTTAEFIKQATHASLTLAEHNKLSSISFPALGTGVGGFSMSHCASVMIGAVIHFLLEAKHLTLVQFVLIDHEAVEVFEQELKRQL